MLTPEEIARLREVRQYHDNWTALSYTDVQRLLTTAEEANRLAGELAMEKYRTADANSECQQLRADRDRQRGELADLREKYNSAAPWIELDEAKTQLAAEQARADVAEQAFREACQRHHETKLRADEATARAERAEAACAEFRYLLQYARSDVERATFDDDRATDMLLRIDGALNGVVNPTPPPRDELTTLRAENEKLRAKLTGLVERHQAEMKTVIEDNARWRDLVRIDCKAACAERDAARAQVERWELAVNRVCDPLHRNRIRELAKGEG